MKAHGSVAARDFACCSLFEVNRSCDLSITGNLVLARSEFSWRTEAGEAISGTVRRLLNQIALREVVRTCDFEPEVA